jgi:hypothetical protein
MQIQEPEQWPQSEPKYNEYQAGYASVEGQRQQEKIYPQMQPSLHKALWILTVVLSSIGFFFTVAGIVSSAIVLEYADEQKALLAGGVIGLISSIIAMLVCVLIFVMAVVALAGRIKREHR